MMKVKHAKRALGWVGIIGVLVVIARLMINLDFGGEPLLVRAANSSTRTWCLLHFGADPNIRGGKGYTPLVTAIRHGNTSVISLLIAHGASVNTPGGWTTPLQAAVLYETHTINPITEKTSPVLILLRHGANIDVRGKAGLTPLEMAAREVGDSPTIQWLLDSGANPARALLCAGDQHTAELLIKAGASMTVRDQETSRTPLHNAALAGKADVVESLLAHGADAIARDASGATPLHGLLSNTGYNRTSEQSGVRIAIQLLHHGCDPNAIDHNGQTPLHKTALNTRLPNAAKCRIAEVLLENGATPSLRDHGGYTTLEYACQRNDNHDLVTLLRAME